VEDECAEVEGGSAALSGGLTGLVFKPGLILPHCLDSFVRSFVRSFV
jgi:hypothetical protein